MRRALLIALAACGSRSGSAPVANTAPAGGAAARRVYAWDGHELVGLYCARGAGLAAADRCAWPETLTLPLDPPQTLHHRAHRRETLEGSIATVHGYGARFPRASTPILIVEGASGLSVWVAPLRDEPYADGDLPVAPPALVVDRSGAAILTPRVTIDDDRLPVFALIEVGGRTLDVTSFADPIAPAALDLDRDGDPEVIYLGSDDGGSFVHADELSEAEPRFGARSGG